MRYIGINDLGGGYFPSNGGGGVSFFDSYADARAFWNDARVSRAIYGPFDKVSGTDFLLRNTDLTRAEAASWF